LLGARLEIDLAPCFDRLFDQLADGFDNLLNVGIMALVLLLEFLKLLGELPVCAGRLPEGRIRFCAKTGTQAKRKTSALFQSRPQNIPLRKPAVELRYARRVNTVYVGRRGGFPIFLSHATRARQSVERPTFRSSATYWRASPLSSSSGVVDLFEREARF
jgi:hypothetical protein